MAVGSRVAVRWWSRRSLGEACVNARRLGLIPWIFSRPESGSEDGGRGTAESGWPGGRGVVFTCGRYFLWEVIRLGEGKCSVPGECRGARKMTPRTRDMTPPPLPPPPPTHTLTHTHTPNRSSLTPHALFSTRDLLLM